MTPQGLTRFSDFWLYYLREHSRPLNRTLHYVGTLSAVSFLIYALVTEAYALLPFVLLLGYGPAWVGHFFIEKNRPATFLYPRWSVIADFRMCAYFLTGRLSKELEKLK